jgi:hypothetical protein
MHAASGRITQGIDMGCDIHAYAEKRTETGWKRLDVKVPDDRDYESFAKLANVRNRFDWTPISKPRGLPDDTCISENDEVDYESPEYVWLGDHSFSWLLLSELLAVDWNETVAKSGLVRGKEAADHVRKYNYQPSEYCQGVGGAGADEYERVEWTQPLYRAVHTMREITLALLPYSDGKPENVRIVFGFDN